MSIARPRLGWVENSTPEGGDRGGDHVFVHHEQIGSGMEEDGGANHR